jgi:hypothetical protein
VPAKRNGLRNQPEYGMRFLRIIGGLLLAFADSQVHQNTPPGEYIPDPTKVIAFGAVKLLIYGVCGWLIYRGFRPAIKRLVTPVKG